MFVKQTFIGFAFLLACLGLLFLSLVSFHSKDPSEALGQNDLPYEGNQKRYWISKELLYSGASGDRMHLRVRSKEANVQLMRRGNKNTLIEQMRGLKGVFQEKLYYLLPDGREITMLSDGTWEGVDLAEPVDLASAKPMQMLCFFDAKEADFHNLTGKINANTVAIRKSVAEGHQVQDKIEGDKKKMEGNCNILHFNVLDRVVTFSAEGFHLEVLS